MTITLMRKPLEIALLVWVLSLFSPAACHAASERKIVAATAPRLALVIGNGNYARLGALENPTRDAVLITEKLQQLGFEVTSVADRDLKAMTSDVDEFARKVKS